MTVTTSIELGTNIKNKNTGMIAFVCMVSDGKVFWDAEAGTVGLQRGCLETPRELAEWEVLTNFVRTPSAHYYEGNADGNIVLTKRQLMIECNRCIVSAYLEQVFMNDGWQQIFDVEDKLTMGLTNGAFGICDFIGAITHFMDKGCSAAIFELVEATEQG